MKINNILKAGSAVFGISAILLIAVPKYFLELLGLESNDSLIWTMQMIGVTVFALAGNMLINSRQTELNNLKFVARIMCVSALSLGLLTLMIPVKLTWFTYLYAAIGFGFGVAYLIALIGMQKTGHN